VEWQLDRWVEAKRAKDFATADAIRAEMRLMGIEPADPDSFFAKSKTVEDKKKAT